MAIRVHQLAKELGITSKDLIDKLHALKIDVKGHMSALDEKAVSLVKGESKPSKAKEKPKALKTSSKDKKPVPKKIEEKILKEAPLPKPKQIVPEKPPAPEIKPQEPVTIEVPLQEVKEKKTISIYFPITGRDLASKLQVKPNEMLKKLLDKKILVTINQAFDEDIAKLICEDFGYEIEKPQDIAETVLEEIEKEDDPKKLRLRAPVVTFMGHVDHGKTSLLDYIKKTKIVDKEAGGITQHIGAYEVTLPKGKVTFLDTPGHAAFTAMRARGANVTDIVVLVVAADDGVMPQTIEAIDHAKAAGVSIVVAINKIDRPNINLDKVKKQLAELDLTPEEWGGKTITVGVSAKTGQGVDTLLEMLLLEAEVLELKANPEKPARGIVIEAELSKGKGPIATILVSDGTLKIGDTVIAGTTYGKIKAMLDDKGHSIKEAGPSKPIEILGLNGVPLAGETCYVLNDEKKARAIIMSRQLEEEKKKSSGGGGKISLEDLYSRVKGGEVKELKIILKADVQGSLEAIRDSLEKLSTKEVKLSVIHAQVGDINESDIMLAAASNAIILGFHVNIVPSAGTLAKQEGVDIRNYSIIYELLDEVRAAMEGLLEPVIEEVFLGRAEVRQVFSVSKIGLVAGCFITKGKITRDAICRLVRDKQVIHKGKLSSLKHFKDDLKEAKEGFECGISLSFKDIKKGDLIEAIEVKKTARRLK